MALVDDGRGYWQTKECKKWYILSVLYTRHVHTPITNREAEKPKTYQYEILMHVSGRGRTVTVQTNPLNGSSVLCNVNWTNIMIVPFND